MKAQAGSALDKISRDAAADDGTVHDNVSVFLHWLAALLVLSQFVLAETWEWFVRLTRHLMIVGQCRSALSWPLSSSSALSGV